MRIKALQSNKINPKAEIWQSYYLPQFPKLSMKYESFR